MRCINRRDEIPAALRAELLARQRLVDAKSTTADQEWKRFSNTRAYDNLQLYLRQEAGVRERGYFCSDSLGVDVEHFHPKADYPGIAFDPENLLFACSGCNRAKGKRFPVDASGLPLLIDPVHDDPWDVFFFNEVTGQLASRLVLSSAGEIESNQRGSTTLDILGRVLNRGAVVTGRLRSWNLLLEELSTLALNAAQVTTLDVLTIVDMDDYGLLDWMLRREGAQISDVRKARSLNPRIWRSFEFEWNQIRWKASG